MKTQSISTLASLLFMMQINLAFAHQKAEKNITTYENIDLASLAVKVDTNWNQSQNTNVVTIKTKLSISNNKEFITDFDFTESFNAVGDKLTQVSGIEELSSCGVSIFRYWESFEQIEDVKSSLTGWIVIVKTGHITKDNLIEFKFDNLQQENRILLFKGKPALIIKTNTIKL